MSNVVNLVWYAGGEYLQRVTPRPTYPRLMLLEKKIFMTIIQGDEVFFTTITEDVRTTAMRY